MSNIDLYDVFNIIEFNHFVRNGGDYKAIGVVMYDEERNDNYAFIVKHDEPFYLARKFNLLEMRTPKLINNISNSSKIDMIQEANYISTLNYMKSRWFTRELEILNNIWKNISKNKKNLAGRFRNEYSEKNKSNYGLLKSQYLSYIFIVEFTKSKIIDKEFVKTLPTK